MFLTMNGILDEIPYLNYMITATKILLFRVNNAYLFMHGKPYISYESVKCQHKKRDY